jgi:hypothetical protein
VGSARADTPGVELLGKLLIFFGAVVIVGVSLYLNLRRRLEFVRFAHTYGFHYSSGDPFGLVNLPFRLFTLGDKRKVDNVLWGTWQGSPIKVFDYIYFEEGRNPSLWWWKHRTTFRRFSCAVVELPVAAAFPPLRISPEGVLSRLAGHVGFRDIELESGDFNARYQIQATERRFAYELIDARMMRWLLSLGRPMSFEVVGRWILAYHGRVRPTSLIPLIGSAAGFGERIPPVATSLYGIEQKEEA